MGKRLMTGSRGSNLCCSTVHTQSASIQEYLSSSLVFLFQSGWLCCVINSRLEGALSPQDLAAFTLSPTTVKALSCGQYRRPLAQP